MAYYNTYGFYQPFGNDSDSKTQDYNDELSEEQKNQIIEDIYKTDVAQSLLDIVIISVLFNKQYTSYKKVTLLDDLYGTNFGEELGNITIYQYISNRLLYFTAVVFMYINYVTFLETNNDDVEYGEKFNSWQNFITAFLLVVATDIGFTNIEF